MALTLADSIASVDWDLDGQARRCVAWWQKSEYSVNDFCFDKSSLEVLRHFLEQPAEIR